MTEVVLIANGDQRLSANRKCQPAQAAMERQVTEAFEREGAQVRRGHPYDPAKQHGFIDSQKYGMEVFRAIDPSAPLVVAEAVWQYSQQILAGLIAHKGPILTVANWSGAWPGLVGMLNLNGCLTKAGVAYSTLWSEDFSDDFFVQGLRQWLKEGRVSHDMSHVRPICAVAAPREPAEVGREIAGRLQREKAIMGVFDEGCMGMYNAIIPDELLFGVGVYKERFSQSALYARMMTVMDREARDVYDWLRAKGMKFELGEGDAEDLTEAQVIEQCKMYIAALRMADQFGASVVGIQYQLGMADLAPASDLVEGLLNNVSRPPAYREGTREELFAGEALPHFNEVDECAGLDALLTNRIWKRVGFAPETTLHDLRWGRHYRGEGLDDYVWVFEISGSVPPEHLVGGYAGATSVRQPPMYFKKGGGTIKGVSKPGPVVWSRVFVDNGRLKFDTGLAEAVALPEAETEDRWRETTSEWPIMHATLKGITRDQMMARHKSNHIQVAYAPDAESARLAMFAKAAAMDALGLEVSYCGDV